MVSWERIRICISLVSFLTCLCQGKGKKGGGVVLRQEVISYYCCYVPPLGFIKDATRKYVSGMMFMLQACLLPSEKDV